MQRIDNTLQLSLDKDSCKKLHRELEIIFMDADPTTDRSFYSGQYIGKHFPLLWKLFIYTKMKNDSPSAS